MARFNFKDKFSDLEEFLEAFIVFAYLRGGRRSFPSRLFKKPWHEFIYGTVGIFPELRELTGFFESDREYHVCPRFNEVNFTWHILRFDYARFGNRQYVPILSSWIRLVQNRQTQVVELPREIGEELLKVADETDFFPKSQN